MRNVSKHHERKVASQYDRLAHLYDGAYTGPLYEREDRIVARHLKSLIAEGSRVLDIGCGTGKGYELLPKPISYVGVDISVKMLEEAKRKHPGITLIEASAERLPLEQDGFDAVISTFGSLSHVADPPAAIQEISRVLKPGGILFVMLYGFQSLRRIPNSSTHEPYRIRAFTKSDMEWTPAWRHSVEAARSVLEHEFEIQYVKGLTVLPANWAVPHTLSLIVDTIDGMLCSIIANMAQTLICAATKK